MKRTLIPLFAALIFAGTARSQNPNQPRVSVAQMEPGLVLDDDVDGPGIARREVAQVGLIPLQLTPGRCAKCASPPMTESAPYR